MPNEKNRKKKDGKNKSKKMRAMRESVKGRRKRAANNRGTSTDEVDKIKFKRGSAGDKRVKQGQQPPV